MIVHGVDWNGERAVEISDGHVTVVTIPARGGKITSLRSSTGVEWLAQRASATVEPLADTNSFTARGVFGWDECAPTIVACALPDGTLMPDHGELWNQEWQEQGNTLIAKGKTFGYEFRRTIHVDERVVRLDYEIIAGETDARILWAAHPSFLAPPGTTVGFTEDPAEVLDVLAARPKVVQLSAELRAIDSLLIGQERKFYLLRDERARGARLALASGETMEMSWDPTLVPHLGIYFDAGRHTARNTIAIEPSRGWFDSAETAMKTATLPIIHAGTSQKWWIKLRWSNDREGVPPG